MGSNLKQKQITFNLTTLKFGKVALKLEKKRVQNVEGGGSL